MKIIIKSIAWYRLSIQFALLAILINVSLLKAQNHHGDEYWEQSTTLAYKTPFSFVMNPNVNWQIKNDHQIIHSGSGTLTDFVFDIPGDYVLNILKDPTIEAEEYGNIPDKLNITVMPKRLIFDNSSIVMSSKIVGEQSTSGIILSVNVDYSSYDGSSSLYDKDFTSIGIGSTISGKLQNTPVTLQQGLNVLKFELQGKVTSGSYIAFQFKDLNEIIQQYDVTYQIP